MFSMFLPRLFFFIFSATLLVLSADAKYLKPHGGRKDCTCVPIDKCDDFNDNIETKLYGKVAPR